jgi:hypothetical protein
MDKASVTYWRFFNDIQLNHRHIFIADDHPPEMLDQHGMIAVLVNWIDGVPYYKGYPGKQCDVDGILFPTATPTATPTAAEVYAWQKQEGGRHYADMKIQPFEFSMANNLDPMQHTIIKYVCRFRTKSGIADLKKARHTLDLLIAWEEQNAIQK